MIIAFSGRRIDAEDAAVARFPLENQDLVRKRIGDVFDRHHPSAVVASAAAGSDLLGLEEAVTRGIRHRVILPYSADRFRANSVTDRPGEWGPRFDRISQLAGARNDLMVHPAPNSDEEQEDAYRRAAGVVLDEALALAQAEIAAEGVEEQPASRVIAVAVWEGIPRGPDDFTAYFINQARARRILVEQVMTK